MLKTDVEVLRKEVKSKEVIIQTLFVNTRSGNNIPNVNSTGKIVDENINVNINQKSPTAEINNNTSNPTSNGSIICDTTNDIVQKDIFNTNKRKKRTTLILGDSIINVIVQHKFKDGLGNDERVDVKSFGLEQMKKR